MPDDEKDPKDAKKPVAAGKAEVKPEAPAPAPAYGPDEAEVQALLDAWKKHIEPARKRRENSVHQAAVKFPPASAASAEEALARLVKEGYAVRRLPTGAKVVW